MAKFDGTGMKKPSSKTDNKHIGSLRPSKVDAGSGGPMIKSGRNKPLRSK